MQTPVSFRDLRRHADCSAANLSGQTEPLIAGERLRNFVYLNDEIKRPLKSSQIMK